MSTPVISVVIPSYDSSHALQRCLVSLFHQRFPGETAFEVVVVDDGSTDETAAMVAGLEPPYRLSYVHKPRTVASGRAAARNTGFRAAAGEVIVMVDADVIVPPDFLAEHLRYHAAHPAVVLLGPRAHLGPGEIATGLLEQGFALSDLPPVVDGDSRQGVLARMSDNLNDMATCWHYMFSCNVSVRREHLLAVGGFDEAFTGWGLEDSELGYRLRLRGLAFAFHPGAILYHQQRQVLTEQMYTEWRRNLERFSAKHTGPDVAAQWILDRSFNPAVQDLQWLDCCIRFEYAVRALEGRVPGTAPYELVELHDATVAAALDTLPARAAAGNLLIIDHTTDPRPPVLVQCTRTEYDLLYYRRADPARIARALAVHPVADGPARLGPGA